MAAKNEKFVYVPIMKSKGGERWALSNMLRDTRPLVRPLIELHAHNEKEFGAHMDKLCADLSEAWGENHFYMDGVWLHDEADDATVLNQMFLRARACGLLGIPVARPSFTAAAFHRARTIAEQDGRGCLIRVTREQAVDQ